MRKRACAVILSLLLSVCAFTGCGKTSGDPALSDTSVITASELAERSEGVCDLEIARRNVVIDGQNFVLPIKLSDIGSDWAYELRDDDFTQRYMDEGYGIVYLRRGDKTIIECSIENYHQKLKNADIFMLSVLEDDEYAKDIVIDDIVVGVTEMTEIRKKYGEPSKVRSFEANSRETWIYGNIAGDITEKTDRFLSVMFDTDSEKVVSVKLSYQVTNE